MFRSGSWGIVSAAGDGSLEASSSFSARVLRIGLLGAAQHRQTVAEALAGVWGGVTQNAPPTGGQCVDSKVIVSCDDDFLASEEGKGYLAGPNTIVVNLVGPDDGGRKEDALREAMSTFDVAVGERGVDRVTPVEVANAVLRQIAMVEGARSKIDSQEELFLDMGQNTFFLSLTYKDVRECLNSLPGLERGITALELRVDLLADQSRWSVLRQVELLKANSRLPVIFTVRSKDQCGAFPDDPAQMFPLLRVGLRAGVEVLDLEACWPKHYRDELIAEARLSYKGVTRLLGSYHVVGRQVTDEEAKGYFMECFHDGAVDAVKVVLTAMSVTDSYRVHQLADSLALPCPVIALCLGEIGKLSRVLNARYTPVTSSLLPFVAAPGQLTAEEIMRLRRDLGMVPARSFYLLGTPIQQSPSPAMHNAGFAHCLLPHIYSLFETSDVGEFDASCLRRPDFGGASVTIPHKQNVLPLLDRITPAVEAIGAVNTIIVEKDPSNGKAVLVGDNTDWKGIVRPVQRELRGAGGSRTGVGLVVGGGGTALAAAYALSSLGLKLLVYNRTPSKAQEVAERFGGQAIEVLGDDLEVDVVVSTIPASAGFTLPPGMLASRPVVMDVAYRPAMTKLLAQAIEAGSPFIQGAEMLIGQGLEQFQLWTKQKAPEHVMREAVYSTVEKLKAIK